MEEEREESKEEKRTEKRKEDVRPLNGVIAQC